jgi:beta-lactamase superfamily II metal-dependent hydrolase
MARPEPIPAARISTPQKTFLESIADDDLVYFLCNVGDGDAQLILIPDTNQGATASHRAIVVDAGAKNKLPALIDDLVTANRLALEPGGIALVVATHPHLDHIAGIPQLLTKYAKAVAEFWDPGYFQPSPPYHQMMAAVEDNPALIYVQPTSGLRRWIGNAQLTVLSPAIGLRNRFDTYGVEINDSSISLRIDYPAARVIQRDKDRRLVSQPRKQSLVLGGDAQTLSWSYVETDFPYLQPSQSAVAKELKMATGSDLLRSQVLKVSHHASKHGVNLELIERIAPALSLVSCVDGGGSYHFPHTVAQELIREALEPTTTSGATHKPDYNLNVYYTCDTTDGPPTEQLGSFGLIINNKGQNVWRFRDQIAQKINLANGRQLTLA